MTNCTEVEKWNQSEQQVVACENVSMVTKQSLGAPPSLGPTDSDEILLFFLLDLWHPSAFQGKNPDFKIAILQKYFPRLTHSELQHMCEELYKKNGDENVQTVYRTAFRSLSSHLRINVGINALNELYCIRDIFLSWYHLYNRAVNNWFDEKDQLALKMYIKQVIQQMREQAAIVLGIKHCEWTQWDNAKRLLSVEAVEYDLADSDHLRLDCWTKNDKYYELRIRLDSPTSTFDERYVTRQDTWCWGIDEEAVWALAMRRLLHLDHNSDFSSHTEWLHERQQIKDAFWAEYPYVMMKDLSTDEVCAFPYRFTSGFNDWISDIKTDIAIPEHATDTLNRFEKNVATEAPSAITRRQTDAHVRSKKSSTGGSSSTNNVQEGCYIATAVYGSYDAPEVMILRRFRDERLQKTKFGRCFIHTYYAVSPVLAMRLHNTKRINSLIRKCLDRVVNYLQDKG